VSLYHICTACWAGLIDLNQCFKSWFKSSNKNDDLNETIKIKNKQKISHFRA